MTKAIGYAALSATDRLAPCHFERRNVGATDVEIEILFCGASVLDLDVLRKVTIYDSISPTDP
jgi:uncharacterized zinc-type alcohol dehydrogenase-like protein